MTGARDAALIESRYGPLGSGTQSLTIRGTVYSVSELLVRMALNFDDSRAIDARELPDGRYVFRYYDGQDQRVVALEFDADFHCLSEVRAPFPSGNGNEEYYPQHCGH